MDDLGGKPTIFGNIHLEFVLFEVPGGLFSGEIKRELATGWSTPMGSMGFLYIYPGIHHCKWPTGKRQKALVVRVHSTLPGLAICFLNGRLDIHCLTI